MRANSKPVSASTSAGKVTEINELNALRRLLFQSELQTLAALQQQVDTLQARVCDRELRIQDASDVLIPAISQTLARDDRLGETLKPVVVTQFHQSARQNPDEMADALFPILGPAIRKMIAAMLTPDPKARKRRYRVEQLFLIDKETGLPICHCIGDSVTAHDADMVSGMLSAIQSFVHEAFSADEFDGLDTLQVGELSVWIEWGPAGVLAAVIRGAAPRKLRESMQQFLEDIHKQYAKELSAYDGDNSAFDPLHPVLTDFLSNHDGTLRNTFRQLSGAAKFCLTAVVVTLIGLVGWYFYNLYDANRWNNYLELVGNEPGIVIVNSERRPGRYLLTGLKDPLARDPSQLLADSGIKRRAVRYQLKPYQSLHPQLTLSRLYTMLKPPEDVQLYLKGTTLHVVGSVNELWKSDAIRLARTFSGISSVDFTL